MSCHVDNNDYHLQQNYTNKIVSEKTTSTTQKQHNVAIPIVWSSVADPERFDADPDPTFHADADPDPKIF